MRLNENPGGDMQEGMKENASGFDWRRLLFIATVISIVLSILVMVFSGQVIPPVIATIVVWGIGLGLLNRPGKAALWVLAVATLWHLVTSMIFAGESIRHPESVVDFTLLALTIIWASAGLAAAIALLRSRAATSRTPRTLAIAGAIASIVLFGISLVISLGEEDVAAEEGDIPVVAENIAFEPDQLEADAGELSVHIDNKDLVLHTFTIDELDVDVDLPGGKGKRVTFEAEPGEYEFHCSIVGHENMEGTLTIR